MLQQPEREDRLRASLGEPRWIKAAAGVHASKDRSHQLTNIHRSDSRPHAHAEPPRVELLRAEAGILDRHGSGTHGEPHRPAHQLRVLPMLSQVGKDIEVPNLTGDLDREPRGLEALDITDAGTPFQDRLAELAAANPVGSDHTYSGHDDAAHIALPPSFVVLSGVQCGIPDPWSCLSLFSGVTLGSILPLA